MAVLLGFMRLITWQKCIIKFCAERNTIIIGATSGKGRDIAEK